CGCAVVAPRAGGIPSLLGHGQTGMLYAPGSLDEAVSYTRLALTDVPYRNRLKRAARGWIEDRNWAHSIGAVRQVYLEAIQHPRPTDVPGAWQRSLARATVSALVSGFRLLAKGEKAHDGLLLRPDPTADLVALGSGDGANRAGQREELVGEVV